MQETLFHALFRQVYFFVRGRMMARRNKERCVTYDDHIKLLPATGEKVAAKRADRSKTDAAAADLWLFFGRLLPQRRQPGKSCSADRFRGAVRRHEWLVAHSRRPGRSFRVLGLLGQCRDPGHCLDGDSLAALGDPGAAQGGETTAAIDARLCGIDGGGHRNGLPGLASG